MSERIEWNVDQFGELCLPSLHDSDLIEIEQKPGILKAIIRKNPDTFKLVAEEVDEMLVSEYRGVMGIVDIEIWTIGSIDEILWDRSRIAWRKLLSSPDGKEKEEFKRYFKQKKDKKLLYLSGSGGESIICICSDIGIWKIS
ncbi:hypothetical protein [Inquilinus limosus]|uniref:hypothetical protein n=1 Tax=Inquilinus limosus TaxID=171674 RepID=UPI0012DEF290|nr:hypothetical protein [Inquilinus limosus]